jgi:hypothetical protein
MIRSLFTTAVLMFALMPAPRGAGAAEAIPLPAPTRVAPIRSPDGVTFEAYEWGTNGKHTRSREDRDLRI